MYNNSLDNKSLSNNIDIKTNNLISIKKNIEKMDVSNHIELLYLFSKDKNIKFNENSNGTFINLTDLDDSVIEKINNFINYINKQNNEINDIEIKKKYLENIFFKQNKD